MEKPVILQVDPYPGCDQEPLDSSFDVRRLFEADDPGAFLAKHGPEVRAIASRGEMGASADMITACPNCELISVNGVGFDAVDFGAAEERNIRVSTRAFSRWTTCSCSRTMPAAPLRPARPWVGWSETTWPRILPVSPF